MALFSDQLVWEEPPLPKQGEDEHVPIDEYLRHERSDLAKAYHPKYDPAKHVELVSLPKNYPASRTPEAEAKYNAARFDPHDFQECRFSPQKGLIVFVKGCTMPFEITEKKTVKLEAGLKCRGDVQSVKHVKLKPLGDLRLCADSLHTEVHDGEWILSTNCAPIELHWDRFFYDEFVQDSADFRPLFIEALKRQTAFYPGLSYTDMWEKIVYRNLRKREKYPDIPQELVDAAAA